MAAFYVIEDTSGYTTSGDTTIGYTTSGCSSLFFVDMCPPEQPKAPPWWVAFLPFIVPKTILPTGSRLGSVLVRVIFQPCWRAGRWRSLT